MPQATAQSVKIAFVSLVLAGSALLPAVPALATSAIGGTICPGATMLDVLSPANNAVVDTSAVAIKTRSDWATQLTISEGTTVLGSGPLQNQAAYETTTSIVLTPGTHTLTLTANGGCTSVAASASLTVTYTQDGTTINALTTQNRSPELSGRAFNRNARIFIVVANVTYEALNNHDGTWRLPAGSIAPPLADGQYDVRVVTIDGARSFTFNNQLPTPPYLSDDVFRLVLTIDNSQPTGSIQPTRPSTANSPSSRETPSNNPNKSSPNGSIVTVISTVRSPLITGFVDDPTAVVTVTVNGKTYRAINYGDGTWAVPQNIITPLSNGDYKIVVTFTDSAGNSSNATGLLRISASHQSEFIFKNGGYARIGDVNIYTNHIWQIAVLLGLLGIYIAIERYQRRDRER